MAQAQEKAVAPSEPTENKKPTENAQPTAEASNDAEPPKPSSSKMIYMIGGVGLVLVLALVAFFFLKGGKGNSSNAHTSKTVIAKSAEKSTKAMYLPIDENVVVNLASNDKQGHLMSVSVSLMTHNKEVADFVKEENLPLIKSKLIEFLETQNYETLSTVDGKKKLRKDTVEYINTLFKNNNVPGDVEEVLLTKFIME